jgi:CPA2 family monovalent cation:H+ antiporter-2
VESIKFIQDLAIILATAGVAGWLCQRLGLSSVVGYLLAGVVVGPFTPFAFVNDVPRIEVLAQLGLVFLLFGIGMRLNIRKMRRLGPSLLLAVAASAGLIFMLTRFTGASLGLLSLQTVFMAAMLMVSSSAIIDKVLVDANVTHERCGQTALGISVLEDVVAVVMLTLLNSHVQFGAASKSAHLGETLALMGAFVALAGIVGLLLVPWLLRRMSTSANEELQTLGLAGLLFGLALLAQKAGYSTALGAFLLGTIVAETPHRPQVERLFEGMRDIFSAVFFVAIGMQIDPHALASVAVPVVLLTVFAVLARSVAATAGLTLIGTPLREAVRTGLMVVPIGEFSFIIAQLGVESKVLAPEYYPLAVGVSLLGALVAPVLARRSLPIATWLTDTQPRWLSDTVAAYHGWLQRLSAQQQRNILWQLSRKRLIQIGVGALFVTGLLVFAERLEGVFEEWLGKDWLFLNGPRVLFWVTLTLVSLAPIIAIWRNLSAMAILYSEVTARGHAKEAKLRVFIEHGLKFIAGMGMFVWLGTVIPVEGMARWLMVLLAVVAVIAIVVLRRKFIYWHSEVEVEIMSILSPSTPGNSATQAPWLTSRGEWNLAVMDCVLPDLAECRGMSIRDLALRTRLGATIVGVERQGYLISLPNPQTQLFPRDKVLLMGTPEQVGNASVFLQRVAVDRQDDALLDEVRIEKLPVVQGTQGLGMTLSEIAPSTRFGVQVAGILRGEEKLLNPPASEALCAGDEILCLGSSGQIAAFAKWLRVEQGSRSPVMRLQV